VVGTVQFWQLKAWKVFKECGQDGMGIHLVRVQDCAKAFITYIQVTLGNVPALGLLFFTDIFCHKTGTNLIPCTSLFLPISPLPQLSSFKTGELACSA
jgi:hypothetical protein